MTTQCASVLLCNVKLRLDRPPGPRSDATDRSTSAATVLWGKQANSSFQIHRFSRQGMPKAEDSRLFYFRWRPGSLGLGMEPQAISIYVALVVVVEPSLLNPIARQDDHSTIYVDMQRSNIDKGSSAARRDPGRPPWMRALGNTGFSMFGPCCEHVRHRSGPERASRT